MIDAPLLLALTAGMVGAINPCGFSLLPAYVGFFVTGEGASAPLYRRLGRAVTSAAAVTVGFVVVFVVLGLVLGSIADGVRAEIPWVTILIGTLLAAAGVATVAGRPLPMPKVALRASRGRGPVAMVSYGAVYAVASLSCTIGPFLAITTSSLDRSFAGGLATYVTYGLGMGAIILAIAFSAALARPRPVQDLRRASRHAARMGGILMIISGAYAIWYARWELAVYGGDLRTDPVVDTGERLRATAMEWIYRVGALELTIGIVAVVAVAIAVARLGTERHDDPVPGGPDGV